MCVVRCVWYGVCPLRQRRRTIGGDAVFYMCPQMYAVALDPTTLHTVHCTLYTAHSTLYTAHSTLHTVHCTQYTAHCTLYTAHSTLHTVHCKQYTAHSTLNSVPTFRSELIESTQLRRLEPVRLNQFHTGRRPGSARRGHTPRGLEPGTAAYQHRGGFP